MDREEFYRQYAVGNLSSKKKGELILIVRELAECGIQQYRQAQVMYELSKIVPHEKLEEIWNKVISKKDRVDLVNLDDVIGIVKRYDYRGFSIEDVKTITDGIAEELEALREGNINSNSV